MSIKILNSRAEIHRALLSHFSLLAEFVIGNVLVKYRNIRAEIYQALLLQFSLLAEFFIEKVTIND
jgi:hypothetical protein